MTEEVSTRYRIVSGRHGGGKMGNTQALGDFGGTTFGALGWAFSSLWARRRLRRLIADAGVRIDIASSEEGIIRVDGKVETLDGVHDDGETVAAFIRRAARDEPCGCGRACNAVKRIITTSSGAGRFLVRDDDGVALVIGPKLRLLDYHGHSVDPLEAGNLAIRDGDAVTVIGMARREGIDEPRARMTDGYRSTRLTPVFRNTSDIPVHVFCAPSGRS